MADNNESVITTINWMLKRIDGLELKAENNKNVNTTINSMSKRIDELERQIRRLEDWKSEHKYHHSCRDNYGHWN